MNESKLPRKKKSKSDIGLSPGTSSPVEHQQRNTKHGISALISAHKLYWIRAGLIAVITVVLYFIARRGRDTVFAAQREIFEKKFHDVSCSDSYKAELAKFKGCAPERCGRVVSDVLITNDEVQTLLKLAKTGFAFGGSEGGASVLDLHSGALSHGQNFVNFYKLPDSWNAIRPEDYITYKIVKTKIHQAIAHHFGINTKLLYLTHPTFFSRLTNSPPKSIHDEYWHKHIDKETYESFHYTSLLYLNDYKRDFEGGRFIFVDADNTSTIVEPRKGRVSIFTSGAENPHYVERVSSGSRFAITVSFTCDPRKAISDPKPASD